MMKIEGSGDLGPVIFGTIPKNFCIFVIEKPMF